MIRKIVRRSFTKPSLTKQSHAPSQDINNIYAKYIRSGVNLLDPFVLKELYSNDLICSVPNFDFHEAQNKLVALREAFDSLSAVQRSHFDNDPFLFAESVADPKNVDNLIDIGVFPKSFKISLLDKSSADSSSGAGGNESLPQNSVAVKPQNEA